MAGAREVAASGTVEGVAVIAGVEFWKNEVGVAIGLVTRVGSEEASGNVELTVGWLLWQPAKNRKGIKNR